MDKTQATQALANPGTSPAELAAIAQAFPELRGGVLAHPNVYPALAEWIQSQAPAAPSYAAPSAQTFPGAASTAVKPKGKGKVLLAGLVGVVVGALIVGGIAFSGLLNPGASSETGSAGAKLEGPGFDTPEAAAMAYLEGLKNKDMNAMLSAFAYESYVEKCDYKAFLNRMRAHVPYATYACPFPKDDRLGREADVRGRLGYVLDSTLTSLETTVSPHLYGEGVTLTVTSEAEVDAFQRQTESDFVDYVFADLDGMTALEPAALNSVYGEEVNQRNIAATLPYYGLAQEEYRDVAISFTAGSSLWYFLPSAAKYNGKWYLLNHSGNLAALMGVSETNGGLLKNP
jgi:hypothetical protein